jgi:hypothetical protein
LELQHANRELVKEKEILISGMDAMPMRETHSTMTSPPYVSAATDTATATSLKVITNVCIVRCSHIPAKCLLRLLYESVHFNSTVEELLNGFLLHLILANFLRNC